MKINPIMLQRLPLRTILPWYGLLLAGSILTLGGILLHKPLGGWSWISIWFGLFLMCVTIFGGLPSLYHKAEQAYRRLQ